MKKFLFLLFPIFVFAEAFLVSDIPLPKTYIFNMDPYPCDEACLEQEFSNGMIFSFLAHAQEQQNLSASLQEAKNLYISALNLGSVVITKGIKIAVLLPYKKIGKYATSTTNAVFAYLMARNISFDMESFQIQTETPQDLQQALNTIKEKGYHYIIAPLTIEGASNLASLSTEEFIIYFPTIHTGEIPPAQNFYFGAIDYKAQSQILLQEASSPLVIFYDKSYTGMKLSIIQEELFLSQTQPVTQEEMSVEENNATLLPQEEKKVIKFPISSRRTNLKSQLFENEDLNNSSVFLDTSLVKSGMIMSQLTLYDVNTTNILSTQINYNPLLLSITQYEDRKDMYIANSITQHKNSFIEANALLSNDIVYDWINYATTLGADLFVSLMSNSPRKYDIPLQNNQIIYPVEIRQPTISRFVTYKAATTPTIQTKELFKESDD